MSTGHTLYRYEGRIHQFLAAKFVLVCCLAVCRVSRRAAWWKRHISNRRLPITAKLSPTVEQGGGSVYPDRVQWNVFVCLNRA